MAGLDALKLPGMRHQGSMGAAGKAQGASNSGDDNSAAGGAAVQPPPGLPPQMNAQKPKGCGGAMDISG